MARRGMGRFYDEPHREERLTHQCSTPGCENKWCAIRLDRRRSPERLCGSCWRRVYRLPTGIVAGPPRIDEVRHGVR